MAPRRPRVKAGLRRMDAALDAMRLMGFTSDVVRTSLKQLLKVYGNDGWSFIEEAAYKLLIDTILEVAEDPQLESASEQQLEEDGPRENHQPPEPVKHQSCGEDIAFTCQEQVCTIHVCQAKVGNEDIYFKKEEKQEQEWALDIKVEKEMNQEQGFDCSPQAPLPVEAQCSSALPAAAGPQWTDTIGTTRRHTPCYGWISDSEDDGHDFIQLTPAN